MNGPIEVLAEMGYSERPVSITQFRNEEDGSFYQVWRIDFPERSFVLKQAKGNESELYRTYFSKPASYAPKLYASATVNDTTYLLMEYIPGNNLMRCGRKDLTRTLDALIEMQKQHWMAQDTIGSFANALNNRLNRRKYLVDSRLGSAYDAYLQQFQSIPGTLCHDDLLPFNVIVNDDRAVFIDWEAGGILPWPTSLARLIAHGEPEEDAFFFMTDSDKEFAIAYYFEHFIQKMGMDRASYRRSVDLAVYHEFCEWVYIGNKYSDTETERFRRYSQKALQLAEKLGY